MSVILLNGFRLNFMYDSINRSRASLILVLKIVLLT
jgi:hypothetical protein